MPKFKVIGTWTETYTAEVQIEAETHEEAAREAFRRYHDDDWRNEGNLEAISGVELLEVHGNSEVVEWTPDWEQWVEHGQQALIEKSVA